MTGAPRHRLLPAVPTAVLVALAALAGSAAPLGGAPRRVYDFRPFEEQTLPRWLSRFRVRGATTPFGYGFFPQPNASTVYGEADVLHVLYATGRLDGLTAGQRAAWAAHVGAFQNATGFYRLAPGEKGGWEPWHVTGDASAALRLLNATPGVRNAVYDAIAANESLWRPTVAPLLRPTPLPNAAGCDHFHQCAHKLVALPTTLLLEDPANAARYRPFFTWLFDALAQRVDPATGLWCTCDRPAAVAHFHGHESCVYSCMGGSFAVHSLLHFAGRPWPRNDTLQDLVLRLQNTTGPDAGFFDDQGGYEDVDGLYQVLRVGASWTPRRRWADAEAACDRFLSRAAPLLNDPALALARFGANSHALMGMVGAVAECAKWFGDNMVRTSRRWRSATDKAAFI